MNKKDLNKLTKNKLIKQLADNEESLVNLRFQKKMQQLENPQSVRYVKREIAQIKTAANLIHEISRKKSKYKTAIILPNQDLLIPLTSSLPKSIEKLSISISNSVINMQLSKFATNFFEMYSRKKSNSFYYKDILNTLSNSYLLRSNPTKTDLYESIKSEIINKKERPGRNPKTKEEFTITSRNAVKFKPSKEFKQIVIDIWYGKKSFRYIWVIERIKFNQ